MQEQTKKLDKDKVAKLRAKTKEKQNNDKPITK